MRDGRSAISWFPKRHSRPLPKTKCCLRSDLSHVSSGTALVSEVKIVSTDRLITRYDPLSFTPEDKLRAEAGVGDVKASNPNE